MISKNKAAFVLFLEGLASSGLQMIAIRQTVPFVGSSVICTSIIISAFLGALALGYYWGGKKNHKDYKISLTKNLIGSIIIFGLGLSYSFTSFFFVSMSEISNQFWLIENPLIHLFVFCLIILCPLVFFLGQTVPLLLNTSDEQTTKSQATGNATALSTLGNVVGCIVTSLILMYYLGVGYSILINCCILAICVLLIANWQSTTVIFTIGSVLSLLMVTYVINIKVTDRLFVTTTPYSNFHVAQEKDGKRLVINRSSASFIGYENKQGWPYIEIIKKAIFSNHPNGKDILVLGAGGFTLSAQGNEGASFTYLDIDPKIKTVAEKRFLNDKINGDFIAQDARHFLLTNRKKWDVIVVDLYTNAATIPMHTATIEFFNLINSRLKKDSGKAMLNIVANPLLNDNYSKRIDNTIRTALSSCITDITDYQDKLVNIIYFCSAKSMQDNKQVASLYRDDTTKVDIDSFITSLMNR